MSVCVWVCLCMYCMCCALRTSPEIIHSNSSWLSQVSRAKPIAGIAVKCISEKIYSTSVNEVKQWRFTNSYHTSITVRPLKCDLW